MALKMADFRKSEPPFGLTEDDYVDQQALVGKPIEIRGALFFENMKGKGVYILFTFPGEDVQHYTTSHAGGVIRSLEYPDLLALLEEGEVLEATLNVRPSKNDKTKTVWEFI